MQMSSLSQKFLFFWLAVLLFSLAGCGTKKPQQPVPEDHRIADERTFPQDLTYYAKQAGLHKRLLSAEQQSIQDQRFNRIFFGPWSMSHGTVKRREACITKARGYKLGGQRWPQSQWDAIVANADMDSFPSLAQPAITIRNTDLREIPTHEARYDKPITDPYSYPFDDFQYSLLAVGMPVFVTHVSRDRRWYFIECPLAGGWVDANDVASTDPAFMEAWQNQPQAAILHDNVALRPGVVAHVGTILPLIAQEGETMHVAIPVRNKDGYAEKQEIRLSKQDAAPKPLPLTPQTVARIGNGFMKQPYGWGGMYGLRDCSATTHDLLAPFGIWLPRNSRAQARTGLVQSLENLDAQSKEAIIKQRGTPFLSLVGLPGHITMYVGTYKNRAALLHNIWGLRTVDGEDTNARHIIGKTIVTSITPGIELPNLYRQRTFVDRLRALATPGAN